MALKKRLSHKLSELASTARCINHSYYSLDCNKKKYELRVYILNNKFSLSRNVISKEQQCRTNYQELIMQTVNDALGYYNLISIIIYFIQLCDSSVQIILTISVGCANPLRSSSNCTG